MKKLILSLIAMASMMSMATAGNGYHITCTSEGLEDGDTVYLCSVQGYFSLVLEDTAYVKNNKFEFKGDFDGLTDRYILPMHQGKPGDLTEIMLENADIDVQIFKSEEGKPQKQAIVKGGPASQQYNNDYKKGYKLYEDQIAGPWHIVMDSTSTKEAKDKAQAVVDSISKLRDAYTKKYIVDHIPSAVSDMLFDYNLDKFSKEEQESVLKKMGEGHHYYYYTKIMKERAAEAKVAVGQKYTDLAMPDPNGKTMKLSDYIGKSKYVLVDFWASWCGPCCMEMPNVVKAYNTYHQKGFDVIGVSFDNNKEAWKKAITRLQMPWHHMSDLKGWGCAASAAYNIKGIPANILVDKNGKIVGKNLRGEDLQNKLAELFK
ncbi:MAG: AhpC/TSA family protein [Prevotella sp.]|nr:AhpC/TSA family protein [Prevotella sp.]MDD7047097.1 TlpA disulfide reductase family protein [Prevotella sp.]MDY5547551.1 TlpA disulfide reductase family protein [Prevotella sp.]